MSAQPRDVALHALPDTLPIFPLAGVLLLPRARLPLNIFEPRYLAMTRDAMVGARMIGMVQPVDPDDDGGLAPRVYETGGVGRITDFEETDDGRYLITLTGLCRFAIVDELPLADTDYRRVHADYGEYAGDLVAPGDSDVDRPRLLNAVEAYFRIKGFTADWDTVEKASNESLVTSLAMICPFAANEKQALLEAGDTEERARVIMALMEMAVLDGAGNAAGKGSVQ